MALQVYTNLAFVNLGGAYTAGQTTVTLATGDGAKCPATGEFYVSMTVNLVALTFNIFKVTSRAGDVLTGTGGASGSTDANVANGAAAIASVWCGASLDGVRADMSQIGAAASLPSTTNQKPGNRYNANDSPDQWVLSTGGVWVKVSGYSPFGLIVPFTLPNNTPYSFVNQSGATVTVPTTPGSIILQAASGITDQVIMRARPYPTPPFILTMQFVPMNIGTGNFSLGGMAVADTGATPKVLAFWWGNVNGMQLRVQRWNSPTSNSGTFTTIGDLGLMPKWFQIEDNNTNLIFRYSYDGVNYLVADTQARTAFLTAPAQIGFCVNNLGTASKMYLTSEVQT